MRQCFKLGLTNLATDKSFWEGKKERTKKVHDSDVGLVYTVKGGGVVVLGGDEYLL